MKIFYLFFILFSVNCISAQIYNQCISTYLDEICLEFELSDDCFLTATLTSDDNIIIDNEIGIEYQRDTCVFYQNCYYCITVEDLSLQTGSYHNYDDSESSYTDFSFCPILSIDCPYIPNLEYDFDCIDMHSEGAVDCNLCGDDCSENGICTNGGCDCFEEYDGIFCDTYLYDESQFSTDYDTFSSSTYYEDDYWYWEDEDVTVQCIDIPYVRAPLCSRSELEECDIDIEVTFGETELVNQSFSLLEPTVTATGQIVDFTAGDKDCFSILFVCDICIALHDYTTISDPYTEENLASGCFVLEFGDDCVFQQEDITIGCFDDLNVEDCAEGDCGLCEHGRCLPTNECSCFKGWSGESCTLQTCVNNCNSNGYCNDGECTCFPGFTGDNCEYACNDFVKGKELQKNRQYLLELNKDEEYFSYIKLNEREVADFYIKIEQNTDPYNSLPYQVDDEYIVDDQLDLNILINHYCQPTDDNNDVNEDITLNGDSDIYKLSIIDQCSSMFESYLDIDFDPYAIYNSIFSDDENQDNSDNDIEDILEQIWFIDLKCTSDTPCNFFLIPTINEIYTLNMLTNYLFSIPPDLPKYYKFSMNAQGYLNLQFTVNKIPLDYDLNSVMKIILYFEECPNEEIIEYNEYYYIGDYDSRDKQEYFNYTLPTSFIESYNSYTLSYSIEFFTENVGNWFFTLTSLIPDDICQSDCNYDVNIYISQNFTCDPICLNGGFCSQTLENTCICEGTSFTGERCETPNCDPACGIHGTCTDINTCECEDNWKGPLCIDIIHEDVSDSDFFEQLSSDMFSDTTALIFIVVVGIGIIIFLGISWAGYRYYVKNVVEFKEKVENLNNDDIELESL